MMPEATSVQMLGLLHLLLCPLLIWLVSVGFFLSVCFAVEDGFVRLRRLHQIPCSHCAFFTGDYRLKCTVHPCKALSEDAIDCLDYEPLKRRSAHVPKRSLSKQFSFVNPIAHSSRNLS